ncbi:MAG: hypothetical protein ACKOWF_11175, partial [Chloroflexota bacterium]
RTLPPGRDRVRRRCSELAVGWVLTFGRHTVTRALAALGRTEQDWTAWHRLFSRARFDPDAAGRALVTETRPFVPAADPYVAAVDTTILSRHSRRLPGGSWWRAAGAAPFARGLRRGQRLLSLHWLALRAASGYGWAVPLRRPPAFPASAQPSGEPPRREWEAARDATSWLRAALDAAGQAEQPLVIVGDGACDTADLYRTAPERTVLLTRAARNRTRYALPTPAAPHTRGARRRSGEHMPTPAELLRVPRGWTRVTLMIRGRRRRVRARLIAPVLVKPASGCPLFLVVAHGAGRRAAPRRRQPWFGLVTAVPDGNVGWQPPADLGTLLGWAWQRWEEEFAHREEKTTLGMDQPPASSAAGTVLTPQWVAWLYAVLALAGLRVWGQDPPPHAATTRWWRGSQRWTLGQVLQGLRAELGNQGGISARLGGHRGHSARIGARRDAAGQCDACRRPHLTLAGACAAGLPPPRTRHRRSSGRSTAPLAAPKKPKSRQETGRPKRPPPLQFPG